MGTVKTEVFHKHLLGCYSCHLCGVPLGCSASPCKGVMKCPIGCSITPLNLGIQKKQPFSPFVQTSTILHMIIPHYDDTYEIMI